MAQLSEHFSLEELTRTSTGLNNQPRDVLLENLRETAKRMEGVRKLLGRPIKVNSGYRSPAVNLVVRGAKTSAHCYGWAVDFTCPGFGTPNQVVGEIATSEVKFDQLIMEQTWVHISFDPRMRRMILTARFEDGAVIYSLWSAAA